MDFKKILSPTVCKECVITLNIGKSRNCYVLEVAKFMNWILVDHLL